MFTGLLDLERTIVKNGYTIVPKELVVDILSKYYGSDLELGILHFNNLREFRMEEIRVTSWRGHSIKMENKVVEKKDLGKILSSFSKYQIFTIKDSSLVNLFKNTMEE